MKNLNKAFTGLLASIILIQPLSVFAYSKDNLYGVQSDDDEHNKYCIIGPIESVLFDNKYCLHSTLLSSTSSPQYSSIAFLSITLLVFLLLPSFN